MEKKNLEEQLKSAVYVTVGLGVSLLEKTKELVREFEEKGKNECEAHKIDNEELKRNFEETLKKMVNVTIVNEEKTDDFIEKMNELSPEDLAKIKAKLEELEASRSEEQI